MDRGKGNVYVLWSSILDHHQKDKITNTRKWVLALGWLGSSLETGVMSWDKELKVELLFLYRRLPPGHPPGGGVSGTSIWEETPGQNLGQPSEIIVLGWPGSTLGQPRRSWWKWLGRWVSEPHGWGCWPHHPAYRLRAWKANISKPNSFTDTFMQGFDCIIDALLLYFIIFVFFKKILTYKVH